MYLELIETCPFSYNLQVDTCKENSQLLWLGRGRRKKIRDTPNVFLNLNIDFVNYNLESTQAYSC